MTDTPVPIVVALKLIMVGAGDAPWRGRFWQDDAPARKDWPYLTCMMDISDGMLLGAFQLGDTKLLGKTKIGQLDLWEKAADEDQSPSGALAIAKARLDGARLAGIPAGADTKSADHVVYRVRLRTVVRDPTGFAQQPKIAHHTLDFSLTYRA